MPRGRPRKDDGVYFDDGIELTQGDEEIHVSFDGMRALTGLTNLRPEKQQHVAAKELPEVDEKLAHWTPVPDADVDEVDAYTFSVSSFDVQLEEDAVLKRKRYQTSDDPMAEWRPHASFFLDHLLRRDGLGDYLRQPKCAFCPAIYGKGDLRRIFRCKQCGDFLQCKVCVRSQHALHPLHVVQEWNGSFWTEASLHRGRHSVKGIVGLEAVYQLGHHGFPCRFPGQRKSIVVLHVNGIFTLDIQFCDCEKSARANPVVQLLNNGWYPATTINPETCATFEALELFRELNVVGNINVHDFIRTLERLSDPTHVGQTPDRYKAFGRMSRQYNFLKRAKHAGRGHEEDGLQTTKSGGLAVPCWACPEDGRNLPEGWRNVKPKDR